MSNESDFDFPGGDLSPAMEIYCEQRASGKTKTMAARMAYPNSNYPGKQGHGLEKDPRIIRRIEELKEDRAETYGLDVQEQIRKYHEIYQLCMSKGQAAGAIKALERLDAIGGFEVKKSEVTKITKGEGLTDKSGDLQKDLDRFANVLGKSKGEAVEVPEDTIIN